MVNRRILLESIYRSKFTHLSGTFQKRVGGELPLKNLLKAVYSRQKEDNLKEWNIYKRELIIGAIG